MQALVEYGDGAGIALLPQQTSTGLDQPQTGFRHADFVERITALPLYPIAQGGIDRIVWHRKWNLGNHHVGAIAAGQVYAFSHAGQAKYHTDITGIDRRLVQSQQLLL